ncbi:MAG: hypothetical protein LBL26_06255 [Peptococcaceae bacterium]|jgi:hypothetical protein|nr:hypothetical protein [Peptococcaceae bacterium]
MRYSRIPFKAEGVPYETKRGPFSALDYDIPLIDYPITPVENFKLSWKRKTPVWAPMSITDFDSLRIIGRNATYPVFGEERVEYTDDWGCQWVYVPEAGGSMLKPGTQLLDDITNWEKGVKFPDWKNNDWKAPAEAFMNNRRNPDKVLSINIGAGCTQVLVSVMGGYEDAMVAMALEQEAVKEFFEAFIDNLIERYDWIKKYYPTVNVIGYNDDWGNERSTFFSESYFEAMVYEPTKRLIDHVKASGDICFELHSCGKIERFVPYMIDLGADILQIQRRANDMPALKEKYGDKIGFCCHIEGVEPEDAGIPKEVRLEKARRTIDLYGRRGGLYLLFDSPPDSETMWDICYESYCYSREKYDKERDG